MLSVNSRKSSHPNTNRIQNSKDDSMNGHRNSMHTEEDAKASSNSKNATMNINDKNNEYGCISEMEQP